MKKLALLLSILVAVTLVGCSGGEEEASKEAETAGEKTESSEGAGSADYEDGIYFAQEDGFSEKTGWKYMVTIEVADGEIVEAEWNGAHKESGTDKITRSESGEYGMVEKGGAQSRWYEQAENTEAYLLETQDPTKIDYTSEEGHTDAISGVTIHVKEFFTLAEKALNKGPVGYGQWKDGHYHAEAPEFSHGYKATADITVVSGYIVAAAWDAISEEGGKTKDEASKAGEYGMVENGNAQAPWYEQAEKMEAYLMETQDPTEISYSDDDGNTDAVSGVSITVKEFFQLAQEALEGAKR